MCFLCSIPGIVNRGNALLMARDAMTLFARHDNTQKSHKWSSNVRDGDCRDDDKMLCNTRGRILQKAVGDDLKIGKVIILLKIVMDHQIVKKENLIKILNYSWHLRKTRMSNDKLWML